LLEAVPIQLSPQCLFWGPTWTWSTTAKRRASIL